jgi:pescadillo
MALDHIIKERYPTFVDALRDLDDALSMLFLFANLPSTTYVSPKTIALCERLCLEFQHYLIVTHSLRKSFLSIKGIYYQATIQGQDILWLVPYKFVQRMQGDIDFRIMGTFIEFYTTLLGFVNYRLYTSIGLVYPPRFDKKSDEAGGELGAYTLQGRNVASQEQPVENGVNGHSAPSAAAASAQLEADKLAELPPPSEEEEMAEAQKAGSEDQNEDTEAIDKFEVAATAEADFLPQPEASEEVAAKLFEPFTFFLGRETPRAPLEFILKAYGCKRVGWDAVLGDGAFTTDEKDPTITHQIVDRPNLPPNAFPAVPDVDKNGDAEAPTNGAARTRVAGRTYVQPQWVWDCINQGRLLRPDLYGPGATLPPHLSPWVKPKTGEYDPTAPLAEQEREDEAELHEEELDAEEGAEESEEESEEAEEASKTIINGVSNDVLDRDDEVEAGEGMDVAETESSEDEEHDAAANDDWDGFSENEEEMSDTETDAMKYQRELEAEALGLPFNTEGAGGTPGKGLSEARKKADRRRREVQEDVERRRMMLPNKKRKLFDRMARADQARDVEAEKLRKKRRKLERATGKAA